MKKIEELKTELEHMDNRAQWHKDDVKHVEQLRNEVAALEHDGKLTADIKAKNKVVHHH